MTSLEQRLSEASDSAGIEQPHSADQLEIGHVQWHCSEDDGGPDVGLLLRLDPSQFLWVGEITQADWTEAGGLDNGLGDDTGWWAILYEEGGGKKTVLARFVNPETARAFIESMSSIILESDRALAHKERT